MGLKVQMSHVANNNNLQWAANALQCVCIWDSKIIQVEEFGPKNLPKPTPVLYQLLA